MTCKMWIISPLILQYYHNNRHVKYCKTANFYEHLIFNLIYTKFIYCDKHPEHNKNSTRWSSPNKEKNKKNDLAKKIMKKLCKR